MQEPHFTHQTIVPVRAAPKDPAEMVTQLLFGDLVEVLQTDRQWRHIRNHADGYEGWIDEKMIVPLSESLVDGIRGWQYIHQSGESIELGFRDEVEQRMLPIGARIPLGIGAGVMVAGDYWLPFRDQQESPESHTRPPSDVVELSMQFLSAPYLWGGKTVMGIDCSGFTQVVFALCGMQLPRDAAQQALEGEEIAFEQQRPGDLAFFENEKGKVIHVGIILEDNLIRHAHGHVHDDLLTKAGIISKYTQRQTHTLCSIKRFY